MADIKKVESVEAVNFVDESTSMLKVEFEHGDYAFMFATYAETAPYIGKDVIVSFRQEMINGKVDNVVVTWAEKAVITTLDKESEIKLYADEMPDIGSNVMFSNLVEGELRQRAIVYCDSVWKGSSAKASWVSLRVLDKKRNVAELKVFNPENGDISIYAKKYLVCDIIKNKYGLNTSELHIKPDVAISANPEITLARQYILNVISEDAALLRTVQDLNILEVMEFYSPTDYTAESGSVIIQTAIELSLARDMQNLTKKLDHQHLMRIIVLSKLYVFTHTPEYPLSRELQSIMKVTGCKNVLSKRLLAALEENPQHKQIEREIYEKLSQMSIAMLQSQFTSGLLLSTNKIWK